MMQQRVAQPVVLRCTGGAGSDSSVCSAIYSVSQHFLNRVKLLKSDDEPLGEYIKHSIDGYGGQLNCEPAGSVRH